MGGFILNELIALLGEESSTDPIKDHVEITRNGSFWFCYVWKVKFIGNGIAKLLKLEGRQRVTLNMLVDRIVQFTKDLTKDRVFGLSNSQLARLFMSVQNAEELYMLLYQLNPSYFQGSSQFVKFWFPASLGASPLASADEFSSNFQTSQSFFARRARAKRQFSAQKRLQIKYKTI